ncbi:MAG TPA: Amuc_1100 family pilus-like protein [Verrucomicrobiae bacterium]|nr:Amuc_1100 family pilus-like protein [Verrucomicrobiae bacterium]
MSWAKRNLYFLISCVLAVALLLAAGWYCYSQWQGNNASSDSLKQAYGQLNDLGTKPITPSTENIEAANQEAKRARELAVGLRKHLAPIPSIPNVTNVDDHLLASSVRDTVRQLALSAEANHVALPQDFAFSFSAQRDKVAYAEQGRDHLARELGEVKVICGVLFSNRIDSLEILQRERSADDIANATGNEFLDSVSITNNDTIVTPYQVTFTSFDPALSEVLTGFANQPYGIMVRTLEVEPAEATPGEPGMMTPQGMQSQIPTDNRFPPNTAAAASALSMKGGLPVVVDEKKLRVTMLLELVRIVPAPGK